MTENYIGMNLDHFPCDVEPYLTLCPLPGVGGQWRDQVEMDQGEYRRKRC